MKLFAYLAPAERLDELKREVPSVVATHGRLIVAEGPRLQPAWCHNVWEAPEEISAVSIGEAARKLRAIQRNWALLDHQDHRRAALIQEQLPKVSAKPLVFPAPVPTSPLGSWMLVNRDLILASSQCSSAFPNGEPQFVEPVGPPQPPSAAYLKLWEALTLFKEHPVPGEKCLDLGACPGGWTWALQRLGAEVVSVDKAPLAPAIAVLPRVKVLKKDAFRMRPEDVGEIDWLFSDVICYPERLLELVQTWIAAQPKLRMICTIKFQGATDFETVEKFRRIPGSHVQHLFHNKHELTWFRKPIP